MERCPIKKLKSELMSGEVITDEIMATMEFEVKDIVENAVRFAEESPWPAPREALEDVYA